MKKNKADIQKIWGFLLALAGVGVFFRVHQLAPQIDTIAGGPAKAIFIRICFYLMGIILFGGGLMKLIHHRRNPEK